MKMETGCCKWHSVIDFLWLIARTGYVPKLALTGVGIAVFAILSAAFWFSELYYTLFNNMVKCWDIDFFRHGKKYMLVLCISSVVMLVGFGVRIPMTNDPGSLGIYIMQYMVSSLYQTSWTRQTLIYSVYPLITMWFPRQLLCHPSSTRFMVGRRRLPFPKIPNHRSVIRLVGCYHFLPAGQWRWYDCR